MNIFIRGADIASDMPTPQNAQEWEAGMKKWEQEQGDLKRSKKPAYVKLFGVRARFATRWMRDKKNNKKQKRFGTSGFTSKRFSTIVPDSGKWMDRMTPRSKEKVDDLLKKMRCLFYYYP